MDLRSVPIPEIGGGADEDWRHQEHGCEVGPWPLGTDAQQPAKVHRIAFVHPYRPPSSGYDVFLEKLRQLGYVEGRNLVLQRYSGEGRGSPPA